MIVGVGTDLVEVARFGAALDRTPSLADRLFTAEERADRSLESLAARFAAKEAIAKALGAPGTLEWHDAVIGNDATGRPTLEVSGTVARLAAELGVTQWQLSLSHDGGMAIAVVLAIGAT